MKINRIDIEINRHANKNRTYLYNEIFSLSREHNCFYGSEFGKDFITINNVPQILLKKLEELKIKFRRYEK